MMGVAVSVLFGATFVFPAAASGSASPPIGVHVSLDHNRAVAGQPIKGQVVLTNTTARDITVDACTKNVVWLSVGLSGPVDSVAGGGSLLITCPPTIRLHPGANRFPVTVATTYQGCIQPQPDGSSQSSPQFPWCTVAGQPPLPAGRYDTKVVLKGLTGLTRVPNRIAVDLKSPANPPALARCADVPGTAPPLVTVPSVVGLSASMAAFPLASACLNAGYASPVGTRVTSQSPVAGSKVPEHSTVLLTTGSAGTAP
jgi:PASTA domain